MPSFLQMCDWFHFIRSLPHVHMFTHTECVHTLMCPTHNTHSLRHVLECSLGAQCEEWNANMDSNSSLPDAMHLFPSLWITGLQTVILLDGSLGYRPSSPSLIRVQETHVVLLSGLIASWGVWLRQTSLNIKIITGFPISSGMFSTWVGVIQQ